jgi:hypothetical protein
MKPLINYHNYWSQNSRIIQDSRKFNFVEGFDAFDIPDALPKMPLTLTYRNSSLDVSALLDTAESVAIQHGRSAWCYLGRVDNDRDSSGKFGLNRSARFILGQTGEKLISARFGFLVE